ncbi:MAG: hypothetical protein WBB34_06690 [Xanthobacteraceae bacterium]
MAFRANYGRDRADRDRAARARIAEKQQKREEKSAQRKAARTPAEELGPNAEDGSEHVPEKDEKQAG